MTTDKKPSRPAAILALMVLILCILAGYFGIFLWLKDNLTEDNLALLGFLFAYGLIILTIAGKLASDLLWVECKRLWRDLRK